MSDPDVQAIREGRGLRTESWLVWIDEQTRAETPTPQSIGLWSGDDIRSFQLVDLYTRAAVTREFIGQTVIGAPKTQFGNDATTRTLSLDFNIASPQVLAAVRVYDARNAKIQIWRATWQIGEIVGIPERYFKGRLESTPIVRGVEGGASVMTITAATASASMKYANPLLYSDAAQKAAVPGDGFFKDLAAGPQEVPWGRKDVKRD